MAERFVKRSSLIVGDARLLDKIPDLRLFKGFRLGLDVFDLGLSPICLVRGQHLGQH